MVPFRCEYQVVTNVGSRSPFIPFQGIQTKLLILMKLFFISVLQIIFFQLKMFAWPWALRTKTSIYESSFWNYFSNQFCKSYFFNYKCLPDLEVDKEINLWVILLKLLFISVLQIIFFRLQMFAWPWGRQRYTFFPHIVSAVIC